MKCTPLDSNIEKVSLRRAIARMLGAIAFTTAAILPPLGLPAQAEQTQAKSADSFVDTIGVVVHLSYTRTPYWQRWDDTKAALISLGVRHFRDGVTDCTAAASKAFCNHYIALGQAGMTGDFVTTVKQPMSLVTAFPAEIGKAFDTFEGPNEVDINGDPNWLADVAAFQQQLYTAVKSNPATAQFHVIGPAIGHIQNYSKTS
jgi:hypothetical protein